jgi:uncharacterized protein YndB with AHSA1/START domain
LPAVVHEVTVPAPVERTFTAYTQEQHRWIAEDHWLGESRPAAVVLEPRPGGRWYERAADGTESDWGTVLEWDPPGRIVLRWMVGVVDGGWGFDPDPEHASRVELTFTPTDDGRTVVRLEHTGFEAHGAGARIIHGGVGGTDGWPADLAGLVAHAA